MPLNQPICSVLITTHNMGCFLPSAIQSALSQPYPHIEVLVVDDRSQDESYAWLQTLKKQNHLSFFRLEENMGPAQARNYLISKARGKYLSIVDADDILLPHKLSLHVQALEKDPMAGVAWSKAWIITQDHAKAAYSLPPKEYTPQWDIIDPYYVVHSTVTWRTQTVIDCGGYDASLPYNESVDLFLKVGDRAKQLFIDSYVAIQRHHFQGTLRAKRRVDPAQGKTLLQKTLKRRYGVEVKKTV